MIMNPTIYKQLDSRWANKPYPTYASSFGGNGCGCCACVHVAMEQERYKNWTPESLRPWMVNQGYAYPGRGTLWQGIYDTLKYIGHKNVVWIGENDPMTDAWKELNKKNRIGVLLVNNGSTPDGTYWTSSGHYVAFTDYKVKGGQHWFYIKDSGGRNHDGWFCYEKSIKGALPQLWIVERLGKEPKPSDHYEGEYPNPKKYLEPGDKGTEVTKLQNYIDWYTDGDFFAKCGGADGVYGNNTLKYVKKMQTDFFGAKEADGLVGQKTIAKMKAYKKGDKPTPTKETLVIDVSYSQPTIDWKKVKADGVKGAIIRCGFRHGEGGELDTDARFFEHIKGANAVGLPVGIYFLTEAINAKEGKEEAQYAIKLWQKSGIPIWYPIGIDSEDVFWEGGGKGRANHDKLSKAKRTEAIKAFADECKRQGYKSMLYASTSWLNNYVDMSKLTSVIDVWCAQWASACTYKGKYIMWQYTSEGSVSGIKGVVDLNECYIEPKKVNPPKKPTPSGKAYTGEYPQVVRTKMLVDMAVKLAWAKGTAESKYRYPSGSATPAFKVALDKAYPEHNSWGSAPRVGASCDVYVGTVVRYVGIDGRFPRGLNEQFSYAPSWCLRYDYNGIAPASKSLDGDIVLFEYDGGAHAIIRGHGMYYEANYNTYFGHTNESLSRIKRRQNRTVVLRPKNYLAKGDTGAEVTKLQKYLDWYTDGEFFKKCGGADGIYGANTEKYVNKMLTDFFGASEADGRVGEKTVAKMKTIRK